MLNNILRNYHILKRVINLTYERRKFSRLADLKMHTKLTGVSLIICMKSIASPPALCLTPLICYESRNFIRFALFEYMLRLKWNSYITQIYFFLLIRIVRQNLVDNLYHLQFSMKILKAKCGVIFQ